MRLKNIQTKNYLFLFLFVFGGLMSCDNSIDSSIEETSSDAVFLQELNAIDESKWDDPEGALTMAEDLIEKGQGDPYITGKAKYFKAYIYDDITQDVSKAYFYYNEALKDLELTNNATDKMRVLNNLGILYRFYGQYDAAFKSYEKALALGDQLSKEDLSDVWYNYGVALKVKGDEESFFKAEDAFTTSLEIAREIDYHENIASVNNQIGMMYKDTKEFDMARIAYKNNIRSYQDNEEMANYVGRAYHGIGVTYMDEENYDDAIRAFEQALVYKTASSSIFVTKYDLGTVLMKGGYTEEAINTWTSALEEKHNKNDIEQVQVYAKLSEVHAQSGQFEKALDYSLIFNQSVNDIVNKEKTYVAKNNKVLFEDIIRDYDEFNTTEPFYADSKFLALLLVLAIGGIFLITALYYKSKFSRKVTDTVSQINREFQQLKVE